MRFITAQFIHTVHPNLSLCILSTSGPRWLCRSLHCQITDELIRTIYRPGLPTSVLSVARGNLQIVRAYRPASCRWLGGIYKSSGLTDQRPVGGSREFTNRLGLPTSVLSVARGNLQIVWAYRPASCRWLEGIYKSSGLTDQRPVGGSGEFANRLGLPTSVLSVARGKRLSSSSRASMPSGLVRNRSSRGRLSVKSTSSTPIPSDMYS